MIKQQENMSIEEIREYVNPRVTNRPAIYYNAVIKEYKVLLPKYPMDTKKADESKFVESIDSLEDAEKYVDEWYARAFKIFEEAEQDYKILKAWKKIKTY